MSKFTKFIDDLYEDYKCSTYIHQVEKKKCFRRVVGHMASSAWNFVSAPVIYPIWYIFREKITMKLVNEDVYGAEMGSFWRWIWTYGDLNDPLGRGGMPDDYRGGCKNTFINRYRYSAIRNPRFTYNFIHYHTGTIVSEHVVVDTRDWDKMIKSYGVGDMADGIIFKWVVDEKGKWYFIYENNTEASAFWFGWVGLLYNAIGKVGRFEFAHRR